MKSRRSTRYRKPSTAASFASAVSGSVQTKKEGGSSMSTPLLGGHQQERRSRLQHGSFKRSLSAHPMNALKTSVNGFQHKLAIMSARASTPYKKFLPTNSKCSPTIDTSSQDSDTPPPPPPPSLIPSQEMPLFDFEGSTNHFKSHNSANAAKSDDLSFSDDGVNLWELANTETADEIDFLLTQIMNNSPMYIRRTEDSIKGEDQISRPQSMDSIPSLNSDYYDDDTGAEMYPDIHETKTTDVTVDSFFSCHDEEEKELFDLARELEELSLDSGVNATDNGPGDEEEDSIPDVFALDETTTSLNVAEQANANKNEDVGSALAWSALSFLLGSPAPASVSRKSSRKESAKLWDFDVGTEGEDIPDLPSEGNALEWATSQRLQAQANQEEEGILHPPDVFRVTSYLQAKQGSPGVDQNDTFTTSSLTSDDTSLSRGMIDTETRKALGSLCDEEEDSIPDLLSLDETATSLNVAEQANANKNEDVDSALAWSALSFLLGSPAPASVSRKSSRKQSAKLWNFDVGAEDEDIPDLIH
eukprot:scaffold39239_cov128-Skeletonema_dohrnii-CCMP3373.AAC.1